MISVKCPACGLVDFNVGDCTRCGTPLAGRETLGGPDYVTEEQAEQARSLRVARVVLAACAVVVLGLSALGVLYLAHRPAKRQWFWSFHRHEPTVAEIFAHHAEVTGGAARLSKLQSFRAAGRMFFAGGEAARLAARAPEGAGFAMYVRQPDKVASEVEFGAASFEESQAGGAEELRLLLRRGFDGERGWEHAERTVLTGGAGAPVREHRTRELEGEQLEQLKHSARATGLLRLAEEYGSSLKLRGRAEVTWDESGAQRPAGRRARAQDAYVVSGVNARDRNVTFYFDTLTGLLVRVDFEAEDPEGETVEVRCYVGDYREVAGLRLPHRLSYRRGDETTTINFEQFYPNDEVADSLFEMPEGE
jgi:hypothetical protein